MPSFIQYLVTVDAASGVTLKVQRIGAAGELVDVGVPQPAACAPVVINIHVGGGPSLSVPCPGAPGGPPGPVPEPRIPGWGTPQPAPVEPVPEPRIPGWGTPEPPPEKPEAPAKPTKPRRRKS